MYGSSLMRVTLRPRDSRIAAREAAAIPLPREDTTPPVTNTNLVIADGVPNGTCGKLKLYPNLPPFQPPKRDFTAISGAKAVLSGAILKACTRIPNVQNFAPRS